MVWLLQVKQVRKKIVLDQKAYIIFYIQDSVRRSSSGREQSLPNFPPACKRLLSNGAGEAADGVDTSADDLERNGCQGSREGAAGAHVYSNGHGRNGDRMYRCLIASLCRWKVCVSECQFVSMASLHVCVSDCELVSMQSLSDCVYVSMASLHVCVSVSV